MAIQLTLLGGFEARLETGARITFARKKAQALLAYLALSADPAHARDKLAALLWDDVPADAARQNLRQTLLSIRRALPAGLTAVLADPERVGLERDAVGLDVAEFERLVQEGTSEALAAAEPLYRGDLLAGLGPQSTAFEEWLLAERSRLHELAVDGLVRLLAHRTRADLVEPAIQTAVRLLAIDPVQEVVHRTLMRLHARAGRRGAALRQYQVCVAMLRRELNVTAEPETRRLYEALLRGEGVRTETDVPAQRADTTHGVISPTAADALAHPIVGRDVEGSRMKVARAEAWRGKGRVVIVSGEAGIGKSRLVEALALDVTEHGGQVAVGHAHDSERILPFGPWIDAFRSAGLVHELAGSASIGDAWRGELARLFPELGTPRGDEREGHAPLFEAMALAIAAVAARQPLAIVLEDLHWADELSARLFASLARRIVSLPVLLVATARPEEAVAHAVLAGALDEVGRERHAQTLSLQPLSRAETLELVRLHARTGSDEARVQAIGEHVWQVSEGNPFVTVEAMRLLEEQGLPPDGASRIPPRVRELIAGRLARSGEQSHRLAGVASVIGRDVDFALLARAAGLDPVDAASDVEELVSRRILHVVGERLDFTHDRIREVAYGELLSPRRQVLHAAVARAIEDVHAADLNAHHAAIGVHWSRAGVWDAAVDHLSRAGAVADARGAHRDAVRAYEHALDAASHLRPERELTARIIDLRFAIRRSCIPLGDPIRTLRHLDEAEREATAIGDARRLGWVFAFRCNTLGHVCRAADGVAAGLRAIATADTLGDPNLLCAAGVYLIHLQYWLGEYGAARALFERTLAAEQELAVAGTTVGEAPFTRAFAAVALAEQGEFDEALRWTQEALALSEAHASAYESVHALACLGFVLFRRGHARPAIEALERGLTLCQGRDFGFLADMLLCLLGCAHVVGGRPEDAIVVLEKQAVGGVPLMRAISAVWLAHAYLRAGRHGEARRRAEEACAAVTTMGEQGHRGWALWVVGEVATAEAPLDVDTGETAYGEALAIAEQLGMAPLAAHCRAGLGRLSMAAGRPDAGRSLLAAAAEAFGRMGMLTDAAACEDAFATAAGTTARRS